MNPDFSRCLERRAAELEEVRSRVLAMKSRVERPDELPLWDALVLHALCREFEPDCILEVGRSWGNSTFVFTEAANRMPGTRVVSICLTRLWQERTLPRLAAILPQGWARPLTALTADVKELDLAGLIGDARRVLFFWDAHGRELGEHLPWAVFPLLARRESLVAVHDVSDGEAHPDLRTLWQDDEGNRMVWAGRWVSRFEEIIPLGGFLSRNRIPAYSPCQFLHGSSAEASARALAEPAAPCSSLLYFALEASRPGLPPLVFPDRRPTTIYEEMKNRRPKQVVIYGAGGRGCAVLEGARTRGIPVAALVDGDPAKHGTRIADVPVLSPEELGRFPPAETLVVVASYAFREILASVERRGWPRESLLVAVGDWYVPSA